MAVAANPAGRFGPCTAYDGCHHFWQFGYTDLGPDGQPEHITLSHTVSAEADELGMLGRKIHKYAEHTVYAKPAP
jgi:hypothetical protein